MRRVLRRARDDEGSTMLLTIGYGMLALALIVVILAATSMLIERRRLFTLADGAALVAAESFALDQLVGDEPTPQLADAAVEEAAAAWLETAPSTLEDVTLVDAVSVDGQTAQVTVAAWWRPPVVTWLLPEGIRLDVTVTARAVLS